MARELLAVLKDQEHTELPKNHKSDLRYPVLIISLKCGFCPPAKNFWSKIADEAGVDLHVLIVEKEKGIDQLYGVGGFPCLVCGPEEKYYGMHFSHSEAKSIITAKI